MKTFPLPGLAALALLAAACAPAESRNASSVGDSTIGIVQCDEYMTKLNACLQHGLPQDQRAALAAEARQLFATWKEAAAHPQHRATLPQACGVTLELAKEELAPLGCSL